MADRRKALTRAYKGVPKTMGVYAIRNTANGKSFVAASRDVDARLNRHKLELKWGSDRIAGLAQDWKTFGEAAFVFETLDVLEPSDKPGYNPADDLADLEQLWLEKLQPYGEKGYNTRLT